MTWFSLEFMISYRPDHYNTGYLGGNHSSHHLPFSFFCEQVRGRVSGKKQQGEDRLQRYVGKKKEDGARVSISSSRV